MRIGSTLYYVLKDHLGSASVITNASGVTVRGGEQRYYPFGESRLTATMLTDKLFTGQREMAGLGIYHYQARFYSPKLGRFLSPDTIVPGAANPQAYNRHSYVLNNPIRYNDPTGHVCSDPDDPTPSCESGNPYPNNTHPLPSGPVNILGGPLDPGLPQGGGGDDDEPNLGGGKPLPLMDQSNGTQCSSGDYYCVSLTLAELTALDNTLIWIGGIEAALISIATLATLPEGILIGLIGVWEVGDLNSIQAGIQDAQSVAAANGTATFTSLSDYGVLADVYHFEGSPVSSVITAPNARRVMNVVIPYYKLKHWIVGQN
jgi:RHS repeat-associated protein